METGKLSIVFFSATGTTKTIVESISTGIRMSTVDPFDITQGQDTEVSFSPEDLVIFGVPVYSGRIPSPAVDSLNKFRGNGATAICAVVYGNREYDDALLELKNIVENNQFKVISSGAFVAEHSIFPIVANGRPDREDQTAAEQFGEKSMALYKAWNGAEALPPMTVKGNFPYKAAKNIPLKPKGNHHCNRCGICVKACPVQAISMEHPRKTDKTLCISCARCIKVCPQDARHFGGILYSLVKRRFISAYSDRRKEPECFFIA